jgi:hypothetical protein
VGWLYIAGPSHSCSILPPPELLARKLRVQ